MAKTFAALAAAAAFMLSQGAYAATEEFTQADKNSDGAITWEEFAEAQHGAEQEMFKKADADKSGDLNEQEYAALSNGGAPRTQSN